MENENKDLEQVTNEQDVITETTVSNQTIVQETPSENKKSKAPLIITIVLLLAVLIGLGAYYVISTNPKLLISKGMNDISNELSSLPLANQFTNGSTSSGDLTFKLESSELDKMKNTDPSIGMIVDLINKTKINYSFETNKDQLLLGIKPTINNKEVLDFKLYTTGKKQYIFLEKIFEKYIEVEELEEAFSYSDQYKQEDYEYLFDFITDSFNKNLDSKYISKGKEEITIDGKKANVTASTLKMDAKQTQEFLNKILDDIKKDDRSNKLITSFYNDFKSYKVEIEEGVESVYTVYTKGITNKVVGMFYQEKSNITDYDENYKKVTKPYVFKVNYIKHKTPTIEMFENDKSVAKIELAKEKINFNMTVEEMTINMVLTYKQTEVTKNKEYKNEFVATISLKDSKNELGKLTITSNGTTKEGATIKVDPKNSVKLNDLTDEEMQKITTKLIEILGTL